MFNRNLFVILATASKTVLSTVCPFCGKEYEFTLPFSKDELMNRLRRYEEGALLQEAFGDCDANTREALKTGICAKCWDTM